MPFNPHLRLSAESVEELLKFHVPEDAQPDYKRAVLGQRLRHVL